MLVFAGLSLIDLRTLAMIWRADRVEAGISVLTTLGVVGLGITKGVLLAVVLALLRFIQTTARPKIERLGLVEGRCPASTRSTATRTPMPCRAS